MEGRVASYIFGERQEEVDRVADERGVQDLHRRGKSRGPEPEILQALIQHKSIFGRRTLRRVCPFQQYRQLPPRPSSKNRAKKKAATGIAEAAGALGAGGPQSAPGAWLGCGRRAQRLVLDVVEDGRQGCGAAVRPLNDRGTSRDDRQTRFRVIQGLTKNYSLKI